MAASLQQQLQQSKLLQQLPIAIDATIQQLLSEPSDSQGCNSWTSTPDSRPAAAPDTSELSLATSLQLLARWLCTTVRFAVCLVPGFHSDPDGVQCALGAARLAISSMQHLSNSTSLQNNGLSEPSKQLNSTQLSLLDAAMLAVDMSIPGVIRVLADSPLATGSGTCSSGSSHGPSSTAQSSTSRSSALQQTVDLLRDCPYMHCFCLRAVVLGLVPIVLAAEAEATSSSGGCSSSSSSGSSSSSRRSRCSSRQAAHVKPQGAAAEGHSAPCSMESKVPPPYKAMLQQLGCSVQVALCVANLPRWQSLGRQHGMSGTIEMYEEYLKGLEAVAEHCSNSTAGGQQLQVMDVESSAAMQLHVLLPAVLLQWASDMSSSIADCFEACSKAVAAAGSAMELLVEAVDRHSRRRTPGHSCPEAQQQQMDADGGFCTASKHGDEPEQPQQQQGQQEQECNSQPPQLPSPASPQQQLLVAVAEDDIQQQQQQLQQLAPPPARSSPAEQQQGQGGPVMPQRGLQQQAKPQNPWTLVPAEVNQDLQRLLCSFLHKLLQMWRSSDQQGSCTTAAPQGQAAGGVGGSSSSSAAAAAAIDGTCDAAAPSSSSSSSSSGRLLMALYQVSHMVLVSSRCMLLEESRALAASRAALEAGGQAALAAGGMAAMADGNEEAIATAGRAAVAAADGAAGCDSSLAALRAATRAVTGSTGRTCAAFEDLVRADISLAQRSASSVLSNEHMRCGSSDGCAAGTSSSGPFPSNSLQAVRALAAPEFLGAAAFVHAEREHTQKVRQAYPQMLGLLFSVLKVNACDNLHAPPAFLQQLRAGCLELAYKAAMRALAHAAAAAPVQDAEADAQLQPQSAGTNSIGKIASSGYAGAARAVLPWVVLLGRCCFHWGRQLEAQHTSSCAVKESLVADEVVASVTAWLRGRATLEQLMDMGYCVEPLVGQLEALAAARRGLADAFQVSVRAPQCSDCRAGVSAAGRWDVPGVVYNNRWLQQPQLQQYVRPVGSRAGGWPQLRVCSLPYCQVLQQGLPEAALAAS